MEKRKRTRQQPRKTSSNLRGVWRDKILIYVLLAYRVGGDIYTEEDFNSWEKMPPLKLSRTQKKIFVKKCAKTFKYNKVMFPVFNLESTRYFHPYNNKALIRAAYILLDLITKFINDDNIPKG